MHEVGYIVVGNVGMQARLVDYSTMCFLKEMLEESSSLDSQSGSLGG